jgi:SulP family sulfate permease
LDPARGTAVQLASLVSDLRQPLRAWARSLRRRSAWDLAPGLGNLRGYDHSHLRVDIVVGVTVASVAVPAGLGMGELAGLSPVAGLYATLLPLAAYVLWGSSRQLVVGPEGALAALTAATIAPLAAGDPARYAMLAATLALLIGAILAVSSLLRLGFMADLLGKPVLLGYINGTALLIIASQLGKLFGVPIEADDFFPTLWEVVSEIGDADTGTVVLSAALLALVLGLRAISPRIPGSLVCVAVATAASELFDFSEHGIAVVGPIAGGLPQIAAPDASFGDLTTLALPAAGLALVAFADTVATARSYAARNGYEVDANRELAGLAGANVSAGLTGAFAVSSSGSRTALADASGGTSQVVSLVAAGVVALFAAFATGLVEPLPKAALGVVVVAAALSLFNLGGIWRLRRVRAAETGLAVVALVGVLLFGVLSGLVIAAALSAGVFVYRSIRPHDAVLGSDPDIDGYHDVTRSAAPQTVPGLIVYRFDASIYFPNALYFRDQVRALIAAADPPPRWFMLNAEAVTYVDATAIDMLRDLQAELAEAGIVFAIARAKGMLRDVFASTGLDSVVGAENFHPSVRAGVAAFRERGLAAL